MTTLPQKLDGVRGLRRTEISRASDGVLTTDVLTEWIWVRQADGRPMRIPRELRELFGQRPTDRARGSRAARSTG